jgi:hypothetical protein
LFSGILAIIYLELTAIRIMIAIEIATPIKAPQISIKVNAAKTVAFSTDSMFNEFMEKYMPS